MFSRVLVVLGLLLLFGAAAAGYGFWQFERELNVPIVALEEPVDLIVAPGTSLTRVVYQLAERGLLHRPSVLLMYLRVRGQTAVQAGDYRFEPGLTPLQLLDKMGRGDTRSFQVTLVEGWTFAQALAHLQAQDTLESTLVASDIPELMKELGVDPRYQSPEGLFFPDTYRYSRGMSDQSILKTAYRKMQDLLLQMWPERQPDLPLSDAYQALTLASIVEKETAVDSEREMIAGVFIGRLRKGMRLQTDPTVIYAMGDNYRGNITRNDLRMQSPYNTYQIKGLPPTPIALPSLRSIQATLHPEPTKSVYFVARGDGSHQFSVTLEEHNRAVHEYQIRNRKTNYRSVPKSVEE